MNQIILSTLLLLVGLVIGFGLTMLINTLRKNNATKKIEEMLEEANKKADQLKRDSIMEAKEKNYQLKQEVDKEIKEKKQELKENELRLEKRESSMDKRDEICQKREATLDEREEKLTQRQKEIQQEQIEVENLKKEQLDLLEKISGFSKEKAKEVVMQKVKESMAREVTVYINEKEMEAKITAEKKAKELIVTSMQRYAADIASDQTVTVVSLPNEDMKGRLIGREGRNIRTIEAVTGVDLIIDDTPEAVVLSSFDPLRREIARVMLETLIKDGRVHPTRIEEVYDKVAKEMKEQIMDYGNGALFELGVTKMNPELIELVGKLHFRTSYGQNALSHSLEVAELAGLMAAEIGEDVNLAKRAGLLHDIGKALDHDMEGTHVEIGVEVLKKYKENPLVINAVEAHHGDVEPQTLEAVLVQAADAISASRPGARRETLEAYIKRLQNLEEIADSFDGVEKSFAIQAGREVRIVVKPEKISDDQMTILARDVAKKVENEMDYPGQIKVNIIRETRVVDYAK